MRFHPLSIIPAALVAATALGIAGCGGGSSTHPTTVPAPASTGTSASTSAKTTATFTLTIPNRTATMSRKSPKYISASVLSGRINVSPYAIVKDYDLGAGSPLCTTVTNGRTCTLAVPAPIGSDTFQILLYDGAYSAGVTGTIVSSATATATIAEGTANVTLPVVLGGVLDHATVSIIQPTAYQTTGSSGQVIVTGYDHDSNIIIAPGGYTDAIGNAVTIEIDAYSTPGYALEKNSGAAASYVTVRSPSDVVTIVQNQVTAGIRLAYIASNGAPVTGDFNVAPVYTTANTTTTGVTMLATPGPMQGNSGIIAGVDHSGAEVFYYDGIAAKSACTTTGAIDAAPADSIGNNVFYAAGHAFSSTTNASPGSCDNSLLTTSSVTTLTTTNLSDTWAVVPGTISSACQGIVIGGPNGSWTLNGTSCTNPRDLTWDFNGTGGFAFTFTSSSGQEVAYYSGINQPGTHAVVTSSGNVDGLGAYGGKIYAVQDHTNAINVYSTPNLTLVQSIPLPSQYTGGCLQNNPRQFVVGDNGHGYLALGGISCFHNGVLEFDLTNGTLVNFFTNISGVYSVASDHRGHLYWNDINGNLTEFPSATP